MVRKNESVSASDLVENPARNIVPQASIDWHKEGDS